MPITIDPTKLLEFGFNGVFVIFLGFMIWMLWNNQRFQQDMLKSTIETNRQIASDSVKTQIEVTMTLKSLRDQTATGFIASDKAHEVHADKIDRVQHEIRGLKGSLGRHDEDVN